MAIQTTANLTNSIRTQYLTDYMSAVMANRLYDQIAVPYTKFATGMSMAQLMQGSAVQVNFLSKMSPGVTAISQTTDITPQTLRDAIASISPTSRGEALQWSEGLTIQAYTNYTSEAYKAVGENMQESVELLACAAATQGAWVERSTARASLDAGTAADRASDAIFRKFQAFMQTMKVPGYINSAGEPAAWSAIMHPYVFHDIAESGNVDSIGLYQDAGIHLRFELGQLGSFRLVVSPWAKTFLSAGAANGTAVATTLNGAVNALGTTITTAADVHANIDKGLTWTIGTIETGDTHYPTNERVKVLSTDGAYVQTVMGEEPNGGLRFDHASGATVSNADNVYTIVFGGPESLVKLFAQDVGEYGQIVGPKTTGILDQFDTLGWKFYGGYGRISQNRVLRYECTTSYEA